MDRKKSINTSINIRTILKVDRERKKGKKEKRKNANCGQKNKTNIRQKGGGGEQIID